MESNFRVRLHWGESRPGDAASCVEIGGSAEYMLSARGSKSSYFTSAAVPEGIHLPFPLSEVSDKIEASRRGQGRLVTLGESEQ